MKEFYHRFTIPEYETIQQELLSCIKHDFMSREDTHSWTYPVLETLSKCPTLEKFLNARLKQLYTEPIRQIKFYCTPPGKSLKPHIDGSNVKIPFGMNFPLLNTKDTYQYWYDCPEENIVLRPIAGQEFRDGKGFLGSVYVPKDHSAMKIVEQLELTTPCITKTDIIHAVHNPTDKTRLIAVLRWDLYNVSYNEPSDVINLEGLEWNAETTG
jgi:hypothetical protein